MEKAEFIEQITKLGGDAIFTFNGNKSGICTEVRDSIFSFTAWYGKQIKEYGKTNIDHVMEDPFFGGKSINDLLDIVEFFFL